MVATSFTGFADTKGSFFQALAKHQDREWFAAHKAEYEAGWASPMATLLAEAREALDGEYPDFELGAPKVFRIHRDVRFSADKSPYKPHASGALSLGHDKVKMDVAVALYLQVGTETFAGAGTYGMEAPALARFRAVVQSDRGEELTQLLRPLEKKGFTLESMGMLKRAPRGVDPGHPRVELLKRKGLVVVFPALAPEELTSRKALTTLVKHAKAAAPVVRWVARAVQD
ncbi:MAG: DUF2461 domain-containing protein [Myxococcales bacterium]|nr:DUF2461 domain-containing protein [Myxococcales bacterium]